MKEIKKPDFKDFFYYKSHTEGYAVDMQGLDKWWDSEVEPINEAIRNGVEISGFVDSFDNWILSKRENKNDTHKALLIGITEIRQETMEDVLRDLENYYVGSDWDEPGTKLNDFLKRAKAVLERGEK